MTATAATGFAVAGGLAVGVDVGGTKLAAGLVRFPEAAVIARRIVATEAERGSQAVLDDVAALAREMAAAAGAERVIAVGVGVPELVDRQGRITSAARFDWQGQPFAERLALYAHVRIEADVRAAALAEAHWGAGRGYNWFLFVSVGTGISSAIVHGGRVQAGARGNALLLGSGHYPAVCPQCGARYEQHLEGFASGPALVERCRSAGRVDLATCEQVLAAAVGGDPVARQVAESAGEALGAAAAFAVNVLDPEAIVVGGGLGLAGGIYWDSFLRSLRPSIWSPASRALPILPAALGADAGLIGAAAAACQTTGG